jgi:hypothetical protein
MRVTLIVGILLLAACRHVPEDIPPPLYDMNFYFVSKVPIGSDDVHGVKLESKVYKKNADSTSIYWGQYSDPLHFDVPEYLELKDSIFHRSKPNCSIESKKWFSVLVQYFNFNLPIGSQNYRTQVFALDTSWVTCYTPEDFTETFVWPDDTLRYIKTFDQFFN